MVSAPSSHKQQVQHVSYYQQNTTLRTLVSTNNRRVTWCAIRSCEPCHLSRHLGKKQESHSRDGNASFECTYNFHVLPHQPLGFIYATGNLPHWVTGTERMTEVLKYMLLWFDKVRNSWR